MKVILQQDVRDHGKKGQLIEVSDGYARNYLFPRKLAVAATADALNTMKLREAARQKQSEAEKAAAQQTARRLEECFVKIPARAGESGRLFGSITPKDIADALADQYGITVEKNRIVIAEPIKSFGNHEVKVKLGYEITGKLNVLITEAR